MREDAADGSAVARFVARVDRGEGGGGGGVEEQVAVVRPARDLSVENRDIAVDRGRLNAPLKLRAGGDDAEDRGVKAGTGAEVDLVGGDRWAGTAGAGGGHGKQGGEGGPSGRAPCAIATADVAGRVGGGRR